ncbi:MAG UNVERIFIED_CONTAM: hypothetical protein LVR18_46965 [Planctomycetaceae bacterium]|jgi:hypothetical protein
MGMAGFRIASVTVLKAFYVCTLHVNTNDALNQEKSAAVFRKSAGRIAILLPSLPPRSRQAELRKRITKNVVWRAVDVNRPVMARLKVPFALQCLALAAMLRFRPLRPALPAWHEMPGQASPERRRPARQLSERPCRVMAGPRGELRGGRMAGLMVPGQG